MAPDPGSGFNRATVSALPVCQWEWNPPSKGRDHLVGRPWGYQTGAVTSCRVHVRAAARLIARKRGPGGGGDWGNWPGLYPQVGIPSGIFRVVRDSTGAPNRGPEWSVNATRPGTTYCPEAISSQGRVRHLELSSSGPAQLFRIGAGVCVVRDPDACAVFLGEDRRNMVGLLTQERPRHPSIAGPRCNSTRVRN